MLYFFFGSSPSDRTGRGVVLNGRRRKIERGFLYAQVAQRTVSISVNATLSCRSCQAGVAGRPVIAIRSDRRVPAQIDRCRRIVDIAHVRDQQTWLDAVPIMPLRIRVRNRYAPILGGIIPKIDEHRLARAARCLPGQQHELRRPNRRSNFK